jgi:hypothetical protein
MAESAFDFNQAPSGAGRQFGVLAGALGLKSGKSREPKGMSAKDQSALMAQQHGHNMEMESHRAGLAQQNATMASVVGHVVGEEAASAGHKRTMQATRLGHKQEQSMANIGNAHELAKQEQAHTHATDMHTLGMNAITSLAENKAVGSFKLPSGASAQFNAVGEAQS